MSAGVPLVNQPICEISIRRMVDRWCIDVLRRPCGSHYFTGYSKGFNGAQRRLFASIVSESVRIELLAVRARKAERPAMGWD